MKCINGFEMLLLSGGCMFEIEVENTTVYTKTVSNEEEQKIKEYIRSHEKELQFSSDEKKIIEAISNIGSGIDLYNDINETESFTSDIRWSEYEECSAEEILSR